MPGQKNLPVGLAVIAVSFLALAPARPNQPAPLTISPPTHNFGQVPVGGAAQNAFAVRPAAGTAPGGTVSASIGGANPGEFSVSVSPTILGNALGSPCPGSWSTGSCFYVVDFRPKSVGAKTANLLVADGLGNVGTATLSGTGIAAPTLTCRPYLVSCNWADHYSGTYSVTTVSSATAGVTSIAGKWETIVNITIVKGVASCLVTQDDWETEGTATSLRSRSTVNGTINGPGLFAIEFTKTRQGVLEYVMHFDCPSPLLTTNSIDYISGTSSTGSIPSEPAEWRNASLAADPQPAGGIPMMFLQGSQKDYTNPAANNGVTVTSTMTWSLERK